MMSFGMNSAPRQLVSIPLLAAAATDLTGLLGTAGGQLRLPTRVPTPTESLTFQSVARLLHQAIELSTNSIAQAGVVVRCKASQVIVHDTRHVLALLAWVIHEQSLDVDLRHLYIDANSLAKNASHSLQLRLEFVGTPRMKFNGLDAQESAFSGALATSIGATLHTLRSINRCVVTLTVPMEPVSCGDLPDCLPERSLS